MGTKAFVIFDFPELGLQLPVDVLCPHPEPAGRVPQIIAMHGGNARRLRGTSHRRDDAGQRTGLTGGFPKRLGIRV
jgi:hypothetical protein